MRVHSTYGILFVYLCKLFVDWLILCYCIITFMHLLLILIIVRYISFTYSYVSASVSMFGIDFYRKIQLRRMLKLLRKYWL